MASCAQSGKAVMPAICGADYFRTRVIDCLLHEPAGSVYGFAVTK